MPRRSIRKSFADVNPAFLSVFTDFRDTGYAERVLPTLSKAKSIRSEINYIRVLMRETKDRDPLAAELFPSAQVMYTTVTPLDPADPTGAAKVKCEVHPLTKLQNPDDPRPWPKPEELDNVVIEDDDPFLRYEREHKRSK